MAFFLVSKLGGTGSRKSRKTSQNHPLETLEVLKVLEWFSKRLCEQALKTLSVSSSRKCTVGCKSFGRNIRLGFKQQQQDLIYNHLCLRK